MKNITILGATGSIGTQTLEVLRREKENFKLTAVSANTSVEKILEIVKEFNPKYVVMMNEKAYNEVNEFCLNNNKETKVLSGMDGLKFIVTLKEVDIVVTSIVGMIGLEPTLKAIEAGKDIALANKETLVVGGELVTKLAKKNNVKILPVDSEHGAIFQCLQGNKNKDVSKIILTASGGPFRGRNIDDLKGVKVEDALNHPNWSMGKKISIDSATLMNKGLEVIEAKWLFDVDFDSIQVVVHPQSIVHSMVEYVDGSVIAQLATPDMKLPIQYALNYPNREESVIQKLDFYNMPALTFEKPDMNTFKCLKLAFKAGKMGGNMPTILNSANEVAVQMFLDRKIEFLQIQQIVEKCINNVEYIKNITLEDIIRTEKKVKEFIKNNY